jgi:hypothetical protein
MKTKPLSPEPRIAAKWSASLGKNRRCPSNPPSLGSRSSATRTKRGFSCSTTRTNCSRFRMSWCRSLVMSQAILTRFPQGVAVLASIFSGADGGGRTHTLSRVLDFESSASANSATSALLIINHLQQVLQPHFSLCILSNSGVNQTLDTQSKASKKREAHLSKDGQWRSFPKVPHLLQYVSNGNYYGRIKVGGKVIRRSWRLNSHLANAHHLFECLKRVFGGRVFV